jgi:hypothetical protein
MNLRHFEMNARLTNLRYEHYHCGCSNQRCDLMTTRCEKKSLRYEMTYLVKSCHCVRMMCHV